ncbi:D-alanyl-D-alanine dipeptidase [Altererythrobacter xixiisoli]|uniref:D-alanyl-D-alanine dipeptidase n=2 Tax=Croceibacterium xixiisoli TaxID=1476466 RepID=A0A6I4TYN0_9SPHN|nr:M15 family metallopeptidase [Croceibacterium xixiisoli]MXO99473.1 D-alanyl-D-alanine dipeptidase [Croceibacterium xixiisoli]
MLLRPLTALLLAGVIAACAPTDSADPTDPPPSPPASQLPAGFVHLRDLAPSVVQDIRYAGSHNFMGRPIAGYQAGECVLTRPAAQALAAADAEFRRQGLTLQIFDCYRPQRAVDDFAAWAQDLGQTQMRAEFYPRVDKRVLFDAGYIARRSGHSRGSTVDLTLRPIDAPPLPRWNATQPLADCAGPDRYQDGSLDFGTGYDCFDEKSHHGAAGITPTATRNRALLAEVLSRHGFKPYAQEWWHYTLREEPFTDEYFDFPVE